MSEPSVPKQHKACVYKEPGKLAVAVENVDTPQPGPGEVLVNLTHSGVCHSDYSVMTNGWPSLPYPTQPGQVGGHEGVGTIAALGPGSEKYGLKVGSRVGIKWVSAVCNNCPSCYEGWDGVCRNGKISGYYSPGTFQQYAIGPADYVTPIPDGLKSEEAAPMLCAGVTTYAALKRSNAKPGQWVVISGAGGGLGHIAVQLAARGFSFRVIGIDLPAKKDFVLQCGAEHFVDGTLPPEEQVAAVEEATGGKANRMGGAHAAVVCNASDDAYATSMQMLRVGGTLVCVGIPDGKPQPLGNTAPAQMVFRFLTVTSVAVGNRKEAVECLEMAARGLVKTEIAIKKMEDLESVFKDMEERKLKGRVVLDLQ